MAAKFELPIVSLQIQVPFLKVSIKVQGITEAELQVVDAIFPFF